MIDIRQTILEALPKDLLLDLEDRLRAEAIKAREVLTNRRMALEIMSEATGVPLDKLTADTNPYEAGLGKVVRLTKEFVGRNALEPIAAAPTNRTLVGLKGVGKRAARTGYSVHRDDIDGAVGTITSGALSPTLGYPIAMAYVASGVAQPGALLVVDIRGKKEPFEITALPFYRRS